MVVGECQTSNINEYDPNEKEEAPPELDEGDIELLKAYGNGPCVVGVPWVFSFFFFRALKDLGVWPRWRWWRCVCPQTRAMAEW